MFGVEIAKAWFRLRTWMFAAGLAAIAVLPVVVLKSVPGSGGAPFFDLVRRSGLVAAVAAVALIQPFFLPLGTSLLSGEAIAGEASGGTLRYLLIRPVGRSRLILTKYASVMAQLALAVLWVVVVAVVAGGIGFGWGPLPTLSGSVLAVPEGILRIVAAGGYVVVGTAGLAAIGLFISTLTDSGIGAGAATLSIAIASQVLDGISSLHAIQPYLLTHRWLAFADLFRSPVEWGAITNGLVLDLCYTALFLTAALFAFGRRDVTS